MKRVWIMGVAGVLVLLVAAGVYLRFAKRDRQAWTFLDGSRGTLVKVSHGTVHRCNEGQGWRMLLDILPSGVQERFGLKGGSTIIGRTTNLVFWIRQSPAPPAGTWHNIDVQFLDENGYASGRGGHSLEVNLAGGDRLVGVNVAAYPRRRRELTVRVLDRDASHEHREQARFTIPNPAWKGRYPEWKPDPLPAIDRDEDLEFHLLSLIAGVAGHDPLQAPRHPGEISVVATFEVWRQGMILTNWVPVKVTMTDATGNSVQPSSWSNQLRTNRQSILYHGSLWTDETAWKLRVEFSRDAGFSEEEIWQFPNTPVHATQTATGPIAQTNLAGTLLSIHPVESVGDRIRLRVTSDAERDDYRLTLVRVVDQRGREIKRRGSSWGGTEFTFNFEPMEGVETVSVTLAWHRSRFGEFMARPELFRAEAGRGE